MEAGSRQKEYRSDDARAFTIIELIVVIAVIGLLGIIVIANLGDAREKARIKKAESEMEQIAVAMRLYKSRYGELPPIGDGYSEDTDPCSSAWVAVMDELVAEGLIERIDTDPWGNYYCYDDNDGVVDSAYYSILYTMGPDEARGARDAWRTDGPPGTSTFVGEDNFGVIILDDD